MYNFLSFIRQQILWFEVFLMLVAARLEISKMQFLYWKIIKMSFTISEKENHKLNSFFTQKHCPKTSHINYNCSKIGDVYCLPLTFPLNVLQCFWFMMPWAHFSLRGLIPQSVNMFARKFPKDRESASKHVIVFNSPAIKKVFQDVTLPQSTRVL